MERLGFIHSKLEIKILILFVLNRLPHPVLLSDLTEAVMCDDGIGYFDYIEALTELIKTQHISEEKGYYSITQKGIRNGTITENSIPYSVRFKAERKTMKLSYVMNRNAMIKTDTSRREDGGYTVHLSLSDGMGDILSMEILVGSETQAHIIEKKFHKDAEELYDNIMKLLL
ncbi:MAG: DUF4364 family protein [Clostridiales bacterium]|jgi:predicted transcriptional regulator|nr:DUF4364 family protein [Clostridiales bacterium]